MWKTIINLLFPIHCLGCEQEGEFICSSCFKKILINKRYYFDKEDVLKKTIVVGCREDELLKQAIRKYKYNFIKDLAEPLGQLMINKLLEDIGKSDLKNLVLIPIPLHLKRLRWRGFNQSELLAQEISQKLDIPVINNLLVRTKNNLPQAKIKKAFQRRQNIHNVFELTENLKTFLAKQRTSSSLLDFKNKTLILIDDISTTGATLGEAARVLNAIKPKQIWGLVLTKD